MFSLADPITELTKKTKAQTSKLESLGINTVGDLLYHFPFRYEDYSVFKTIAEIVPGETVTTQGMIIEIKRNRIFRRRMTITEAYIQDQTGSIKVAWFNVFGPLQFLSKGKCIQISGKAVLSKKNELQLQHPNFELISKKQLEANKVQSNNKLSSTGVLVPVYPETKGLTSYWLRANIKKALSKTELIDPIPLDIAKNQKLIPLADALNEIHFPSSMEKMTEAKKRFAFEKMFLIQLKALSIKQKWDANKAKRIPFDEKLVIKFVSSLPFTLTNAQKKTAWQIIKDLEKEKPMNRLLEGDVGSGKTVVAAIAALSASAKDHQVAILAPTEVLALQHFKNLSSLLASKNCTVALLTGSHSKIEKEKFKKEDLKERLKDGDINIAIGTHALLQKDVHFKNLALVIIDEQHRFGVKQRALLQQKTIGLDDGSNKEIPHLLTMTATPIPRTLSLAIFGNLNLSIIDEYPKGRKEISTKVIPPKGREQIYSFVQKEIASGRQAFIIYPLVTETSKMNEVKAATEEHKNLQENVFPKLKLGLLHGKIKPKEKEQIMQDFKNKKYDVLVATSVVEVGVDIPNASIMIIEGAERFGLAQLHQFRGRVGRSTHQSYCFLLTSDNVPGSTKRLRALERTNDGFKIAEEDLKLRGPGQFMGVMQSGVADIAMESLTDVKMIQSARDEAQRIISFDSKLKKFPLLKATLNKMDKITHWE